MIIQGILIVIIIIIIFNEYGRQKSETMEDKQDDAPVVDDTVGGSEQIADQSTIEPTSDDQTNTYKLNPSTIEQSVLDQVDRVMGNNQILDADDEMYNKMKDVSSHAKESVLHRTRYTSDNFRKYFAEELDEQESRHWWED